jgi:biopolymer transport protein TolQ
VLSEAWSFLFGAETLTTRVVMGLLVVMSLSSWATIGYRAVGYPRARERTRRDTERFNAAATLQEAVGAVTFSRSHSLVGPVCRLAWAELERLRATEAERSARDALIAENVQRALGQGIRRATEQLSGGLSFLGTCAYAAPLLGLFGTVWGIMRAFFAVAGAAQVSLKTIAPGMAEALTTTIVGLVVAIPATVGYNALVRQLAKVEVELLDFSDAFMNRVRRESLPRLDARDAPDARRR